jgi:hypothetical protein
MTCRYNGETPRVVNIFPAAFKRNIIIAYPDIILIYRFQRAMPTDKWVLANTWNGT